MAAIWKFVISIGIVCFFFAIPGISGQIDHKKDLSNVLDSWAKSYYNDDISRAKKKTLKLIEKLKYYQKIGAEGYNYNLMLGFSYTRLYLMEMAEGDTEKAKMYMKKCLALDPKNENLDPSDIKREKDKIINFVREMDCSHSIKWMDCEKIRED